MLQALEISVKTCKKDAPRRGVETSILANAFQIGEN